MLHDLKEQLNPSKPELWLTDIRKVSQLKQQVNKSAEAYMARVRHLANRLGYMPVAEVMPLFALLGMDHSKYNGLLARFTSGNPSIVTANMSQLETKMTDEDSRKMAMGISPTPFPSASRVSNREPTSRQAPSPTGPCPGSIPSPSSLVSAFVPSHHRHPMEGGKRDC